jgi:glycosyltransferase involved in cell wall biosynthesis
VGHCELARAQLDAAILFYPTFFRENCSSSIIECMLAGCVPVTSWLGGIPELVFTTVDGIVLHVADDVCFGIAGDEAKWEYHWRYIDAIMNLCTDRELLAEYGLMARHLAHLRFNIKKQTKYLEAILA